jgi:hypothetical protein
MKTQLAQLKTVRPGTGWRLFIIFAVFAALQPAPLLIVPGPQQQVETNYPGLGLHTRLTDEVEPWKIQRSLELVREMGAPWIVEFFPWAYYQGADRNIAWEHPDLVVNHAHAQGLQIIARLGLTPDWARPPDTALNYLDAAAYDAFAAFAAAFAARYQGKVQAIVVWNEPNLSFEWGYRQTTPADYVALLAAVYPAVKAANPDMLVLAGALAPTLEPAGSPWGLNDLEYLDQMYAAGAAAYFDGLAVHVYGLTFPPEAEPDPGVLNFRRVELMREVMTRHGDGDTKMYITETGWNDHPRWTRSVRPGQRIQYTMNALDHARQNWPYVEVLAIWAFRYPAPTRSYMDYFTLVTPEFIPKPLYHELQVYTGNSR